MTPRYGAAAVQMHATADKECNLATASRLVAAAAGRGASLVVLPELFNLGGRLEQVAAAAEPIPGPASDALGKLAQQHGILLVGGSICERSSEAGRGYNTSLCFGPDGRLLARYRKIHLFDIELPGRLTNRESQWILPGSAPTTVETPYGHCGLATCYDLRFPELFRALVQAGSQVLAIPSAFSYPTGEAHWEVLLRARAIENQCYVVAANQHGPLTDSFTCYGHSMIVDPWGRILAQGSDDTDEMVTAEIDLDRLAEMRRHLPALGHRRLGR